jgi:hypothetical protein
MDIIGIVCAPLAGYWHAGHRPTAGRPSMTDDRMLHVSDDPGEILFSLLFKSLMGSLH